MDRTTAITHVPRLTKRPTFQRSIIPPFPAQKLDYLVPMGNESKVKIALTVNGEAAEVAFAPHKTLLEVLREDMGLTGTKHGCELASAARAPCCWMERRCCRAWCWASRAPATPCAPSKRWRRPASSIPCRKRSPTWVPRSAATAHPRFSSPPRRYSSPIQADTRRNQGRSVGQPLPLHRLHQDL